MEIFTETNHSTYGARRRSWWTGRLLPFAFVAAGVSAACSSSDEGRSVFGGSGAAQGAGAMGQGADPAGDGMLHIGSTGGSTGASGSSSGSFTACTGVSVAGEQVKQSGPLDVYLVFDRTASMGKDCAFTPGTMPPVASKACYATYAIAEYVMSVNRADDTHLAFQFMSLDRNDCNGVPYGTPLIDMTPLPVDANNAIVQTISNETFMGGLGTHIEGAIRGISSYTINHDRMVAPMGRTTIGILMTDGDPNGCNENIAQLSQLVTQHFMASGGAVKMFFIGETGATLSNLESYAVQGGAAAHPDFCGNGPTPCHYWDVGDGQPAAFASAMASIVGQATVAHPLPCTFKVPPAPSGQTLDPNLVNVDFTQGGNAVGIYRVDSSGACDSQLGGWYYDHPSAPGEILLCPASCSKVMGSVGAMVNVEFGCASQSAPVR